MMERLSNRSEMRLLGLYIDLSVAPDPLSGLLASSVLLSTMI